MTTKKRYRVDISIAMFIDVPQDFTEEDIHEELSNIDYRFIQPHSKMQIISTEWRESELEDFSNDYGEIK